MQRVAYIALGFTEELVVQDAEIQAQQRDITDPGDRLCRQALAAAVHTEQHDTFGCIRLVVDCCGQLRASLLEPFLERGKPPMSDRCAVSNSNDSNPFCPISVCLALATSATSLAVIAPSS